MRRTDSKDRLAIPQAEPALASPQAEAQRPLSEAAAGGESQGGLFTCSIDQSCNVTGEEAETRRNSLVLRARRCNSWLCQKCAGTKSFKESKRVQAVMENWKFPMMWTLTTNPRAYPDPRKIWDWIRQKRLVSRLVQELDRKGYLRSRDWYAVAEFQMGDRLETGQPTKQPHFHILLDAKGPIPHAVVWRLWEQMAPAWRESGEICGRADQGSEPAMGYVQFEKVKQVDKIANYLMKYLSKGPAKLPEWFTDRLDEGHNFQLRYHSRGFFRNEEKKPVKPRPKLTEEQKAKRKANRRTATERIKDCRHDADVYVKKETVGSTEHRYVDYCAYSFEECVNRLKLSDKQHEEIKRSGRVFIQPQEFVRIAGVQAWERLRNIIGDDPVGPENWDEPHQKYFEEQSKKQLKAETSRPPDVSKNDSLLGGEGVLVSGIVQDENVIERGPRGPD